MHKLLQERLDGRPCLLRLSVLEGLLVPSILLHPFQLKIEVEGEKTWPRKRENLVRRNTGGLWRAFLGPICRNYRKILDVVLGAFDEQYWSHREYDISILEIKVWMPFGTRLNVFLCSFACTTWPKVQFVQHFACLASRFFEFRITLFQGV